MKIRHFAIGLIGTAIIAGASFAAGTTALNAQGNAQGEWIQVTARDDQKTYFLHASNGRVRSCNAYTKETWAPACGRWE